MSDFKAKMHKIRFTLERRPRPTGGAYSAVFKGLLLRRRGGRGGRERRSGGEGNAREEEGKGREGKGRGGQPPNILAKNRLYRDGRPPQNARVTGSSRFTMSDICPPPPPLKITIAVICPRT